MAAEDTEGRGRVASLMRQQPQPPVIGPAMQPEEVAQPPGQERLAQEVKLHVAAQRQAPEQSMVAQLVV